MRKVAAATTETDKERWSKRWALKEEEAVGENRKRKWRGKRSHPSRRVVTKRKRNAWLHGPSYYYTYYCSWRCNCSSLLAVAVAVAAVGVERNPTKN